jgi:hypothetical protein
MMETEQPEEDPAVNGPWDVMVHGDLGGDGMSITATSRSDELAIWGDEPGSSFVMKAYVPNEAEATFHEGGECKTPPGFPAGDEFQCGI